MAELRELFFESAGELVENLNDQAMQLEKSPGEAESIRSLRRTVHTLKGDAAACGFRELSELAHEFEDVLGLEKTAAAASVPAIALRAADVFSAMLEAYRGKKKLPSIQPLREEIARLAHPEAAGAGEKKKKAASRHTIRWSEYEQLSIAQAADQGKRLYHVTVQLDPQCGMPIAARQLVRIALAAIGEVLALYPGAENRESTDRVEVALASEKSAEQIRVKCQIPTIALQARVATLRPKAPARAAAARSDGNPGRKAATAAPDPASLAADEPSASPAKETVAAPGSTGPDNILRVDAERIDSVLNLVGELILAKSMLQQTLL